MKHINNDGNGASVGGSSFRRSSFCASNECIEVAMTADGTVRVRGAARNVKQQALTFTRQEWVAFIAGVKNNEFEPE